MSSYDYTFKILCLGDDSELKTSFTKRYCYNIFNPSERLTIGVDFHVKTIDFDHRKIKMQLWDVGGEERFRFLLPTYCLGANGAFLFLDLTRSSSLDNIGEWTSILRQKGGLIPIGLVGLRLDETNNRQITREYGIQVAEKNELAFYGEASAKTGKNINVIFQVLIERILERTEKAVSKQNFRNIAKLSIFDLKINPKEIREMNLVIDKLMRKFDEWAFFILLSKENERIEKPLIKKLNKLFTRKKKLRNLFSKKKNRIRRKKSKKIIKRLR